MSGIIQKCREHFIKTFKSDPEPLYLTAIEHINKVEAWAMEIAKDYPEVDLEVLLCSVWLHDIGFFTEQKFEDHAIGSEVEARRFLGLNQMEDRKIDRIAHCVRTHRCRDILPESIEAKILAVADSASHFNDVIYADMLARGLKKEVNEKIERDYRDIELLPGVKPKVRKLYNAWKILISIWGE